MQEVVASFTTVMTWLVLLMSGIAVVLLGLDAWHLHAHRRRALFGVLGMALVLIAVAASLLLFAARHPQHGPLLSQLLLPLVASLLMLSLYRLSFPPEGPSPASHLTRLRQLLLLVLTAGALLAASGLVLLDLVLP
ncbi:MAG TPA: hypothetical protein VF026_10110 [Ktedonobacteraceae bacterium]